LKPCKYLYSPSQKSLFYPQKKILKKEIKVAQRVDIYISERHSVAFPRHNSEGDEDVKNIGISFHLMGIQRGGVISE
jgi:hypothetical protein